MKNHIGEQIHKNGFYAKPHYLIEWVKEGKICKAEFVLLDLLIHYENWFTRKPEKCFFHTDEQICKIGLISPKTLVKARRSLKQKNLIDFRKGNSHRATEYKILLNHEDYYRASSWQKSSE